MSTGKKEERKMGNEGENGKEIEEREQESQKEGDIMEWD